MSVIIQDNKLWPLFIGMVCESLSMEGYTGDAYKLASSLDMTFEEIKRENIKLWQEIINEDLAEYRAKEGAEFFK